MASNSSSTYNPTGGGGPSSGYGAACPRVHSRRCFALNCCYNTFLPMSVTPIRCDCGVALYCSPTCKSDMFEHSHKYACPHIKAITNGTSKLGDFSEFGASELTKKEQEASENSAIAALAEKIASMSVKELKSELVKYRVNTTTFVEKTEFAQALQKEKEQDLIEHKRIQANLSYPAVLWKGQFSKRRFRVGQRVEFRGPDAKFQPGTITELYFEVDYHGSNMLQYEMEADHGMYTSAPCDDNWTIRCLKGANLLYPHIGSLPSIEKSKPGFPVAPTPNVPLPATKKTLPFWISTVAPIVANNPLALTAISCAFAPAVARPRTATPTASGSTGRPTRRPAKRSRKRGTSSSANIPASVTPRRVASFSAKKRWPRTGLKCSSRS